MNITKNKRTLIIIHQYYRTPRRILIPIHRIVPVKVLSGTTAGWSPTS